MMGGTCQGVSQLRNWGHGRKNRSHVRGGLSYTLGHMARDGSIELYFHSS